MKPILQIFAMASLLVAPAALAQSKGPETPPAPKTTPSVKTTPAVKATPPATTTPTPKTSPSLTPEERAMLEEGLQAGKKTVKLTGIKVLPDIGLCLDTAFAWFTGEPGSDQFGAHDSKKNGFNLNQLELTMGGSVGPYFQLRAYMVLGVEGIEIEEVYAQTSALPGGLQMRLGMFRHRFGQINSHHLHSWNFVDLPIVSGKLIGSSASQGLGAELSWLMPVGWYSELVASGSMLGYGHGANRSFKPAPDPHAGGGDAHAHGAGPGIDGLDDLIYAFSWRNYNSLGDDWGLKWGLSASLGPNGKHRSELYAADLKLRFRPAASRKRAALTLQSEFLVRRRHFKSETLMDWGAYTQLVWSINPSWELGFRHGFASGLENDPLDPTWTSTKHRGSVALSYWPSHFSRFRLQANVHNFGVEDAHAEEEGADHDDHSGLPVNFSVFLSMEFFVGTHPAHQN